MPTTSPYQPLYDAMIALEWNYTQEIGRYDGTPPLGTYRIDVARINRALSDALAVCDAFIAANPPLPNDDRANAYGRAYRSALRDFQSKIAPLLGVSASNSTLRTNLSVYYDQYLRGFHAQAHQKERTGATRVS